MLFLILFPFYLVLPLFCFYNLIYILYIYFFFATCISLELRSGLDRYLLSLNFFQRLIFPDLNDNICQVKKLRFLVNPSVR